MVPLCSEGVGNKEISLQANLGIGHDCGRTASKVHPSRNVELTLSENFSWVAVALVNVGITVFKSLSHEKRNLPVG